MAYPYASTSPSPIHTPTGSTTPTGGTRLSGYGLSQQQQGGGNPRLSPFFNERRTRTLPMYKDKPYFAPRRTGPRSRRRKAVYAAFCLFVVTLLWRWVYGPMSWDGFGSRGRNGPDWAKGKELYEWMLTLEDESGHSSKGTSGGTIDWDARREKVRDAMIVSWDGYEQFAWGELASLSDWVPATGPGLTDRLQDSMNSARYRNEARILAIMVAWGGLSSTHWIR